MELGEKASEVWVAVGGEDETRSRQPARPFDFALSKIPTSRKSGEKWGTPFSVASVGRRPMTTQGRLRYKSPALRESRYAAF